ncbi:PepSY-associated TM helix domain-containing protein [Paracraurococcus ruber]|uniref:PepSY-associated TM helix domain-containing protein n=1 Tax=Paracraurococcus ruber TaxID=77675 RepID=UPI00195F62F6|nr:PepSY domain-containing protein [Paracraurococcus ruber]
MADHAAPLDAGEGKAPGRPATPAAAPARLGSGAARRLWLWSRLHTWSSLACTVFLLLLCLTGLPLIFHDELGDLLGHAIAAPDLPPGTPPADLDAVVAAAQAQRPGEVVQYLIWEEDPAILRLSLAPSPSASPDALTTVLVDARTGRVLGEPRDREGFLYWMLRLHTDLFAGIPGKLFLGGMGLLFLLAIVSGAVLYGPFARHGGFGAVRRGRSARLRWLDRHNILGVVTLSWALVVGATGVVNTLAEQVLAVWRADQLAAMTAPWRGQDPVAAPGSVQAAVDAARAAAPGRQPFFVAWPQTMFTSGHHYGVYLRGDTPLTHRLFIPALVEAETGVLTDLRPMPWYVQALLLSQPLHFGDYGGLPLKLAWAVLDLVTIVVLGSGLWLWWAGRRGGTR